MGNKLSDVLGRVVISPKENLLAGAIKDSLDFHNGGRRGRNGRGQNVLPDPDSLLDVTDFSSREHVITLLDGEIPNRGNLFTYVDAEGVTRNFFNVESDRFYEGKTVYIVATPSNVVLPEVITHRTYELIDALKEQGADRVFVVASESPFARQDRGANSYNRGSTAEEVAADRKKHRGQGITTRVVLRALIANGCDGMFTLDHHSRHIDKIVADVLREQNMDPNQRFLFNLPQEPPLAAYLATTDILDDGSRDNFGEGIVGIAPDKSAAERVVTIFDLLNWSNAAVAFIDKSRIEANNPDALSGALIPVKNYDEKTGYTDKSLIIIDDLSDTFGSVDYAISRAESARKVVVCGTHFIFAGKAEWKIRRNPYITDLIGFDTRPSRARKFSTGVKNITTLLKPARYFADAIVTYAERWCNVDPRDHYINLFRRDPFTFARLAKEHRFTEHYSKG